MHPGKGHISSPSRPRNSCQQAGISWGRLIRFYGFSRCQESSSTVTDTVPDLSKDTESQTVGASLSRTAAGLQSSLIIPERGNWERIIPPFSPRWLTVVQLFLSPKWTSMQQLSSLRCFQNVHSGELWDSRAWSSAHNGASRWYQLTDVDSRDQFHFWKGFWKYVDLCVVDAVITQHLQLFRPFQVFCHVAVMWTTSNSHFDYS